MYQLKPNYFSLINPANTFTCFYIIIKLIRYSTALLIKRINPAPFSMLNIQRNQMTIQAQELIVCVIHAIYSDYNSAAWYAANLLILFLSNSSKDLSQSSISELIIELFLSTFAISHADTINIGCPSSITS